MPILLVIAFVVLGAGVYLHPQNQAAVQPTPAVQGETAPTPTDPPTPTDIPMPTFVLPNSPTVRPSPTTPPKPTIIPTVSQDTSSWQYPGSQKTSDTLFTSTDDPKVITDWYKNKINTLGYQAKSFVTTSANDKIVNKLVAAQNSSEVSVEITKNPGDSATTIKVVLDN